VSLDTDEILHEEAEQALLREARDRRFIYHDVETLVSVGYLHQAVRIDPEHTLVLRSLSTEGARRLVMRTEGLESFEEIVRWTISSSLHMVDGFEIDTTDPNAALGVYREWVRYLPVSVLEVLFSVFSGLSKRISRASELHEAFCYEPYSRVLWRTWNTNRVPENHLQQMWVTFNISEDRRRAEVSEWSRTRAIVSSLSNKGGKQLGKILDAQDRSDKEHRQRVIEEAVNWVLYGDAIKPPTTVKINGRDVEVSRIHSPHTTRDLEDEMRKVRTGERDHHDTLVEEYHRGIRIQTEARQQAFQKKVLDARMRSIQNERAGELAVVGYTKEQLEALSPGSTSARTTAQVGESARTSHIYERYFRPQLRAGGLTPSLGVEDIGAVEPEGTEPEPSRLQTAIQDRKPQLR